MAAVVSVELAGRLKIVELLPSSTRFSIDLTHLMPPGNKGIGASGGGRCFGSNQKRFGRPLLRDEAGSGLGASRGFGHGTAERDR